MNILPLELEENMISYLENISLFNYSCCDKAKYNNNKKNLKKRKIISKIQNLNLSNHAKDNLINNLNSKNLPITLYEKYIDRIKNFKPERYIDG